MLLQKWQHNSAIMHSLVFKKAEKQGVNLNGTYYYHKALDNHIGEEVCLVATVGMALVYDSNKNFVCTLENELSNKN